MYVCRDELCFLWSIYLMYVTISDDYFFPHYYRWFLNLEQFCTEKTRTENSTIKAGRRCSKSMSSSLYLFKLCEIDIQYLVNGCLLISIVMWKWGEIAVQFVPLHVFIYFGRGGCKLGWIFFPLVFAIIKKYRVLGTRTCNIERCIFW